MRLKAPRCAVFCAHFQDSYGIRRALRGRTRVPYRVFTLDALADDVAKLHQEVLSLKTNLVQVSTHTT